MKRGPKTGKSITRGILSFAVVAAFLMFTLASPATPATSLRKAAQSSIGTADETSDPSTQLVGFYDVSEPASENGTGAGDNILQLINTTSSSGDLCAMIYVFDDDEEMGECCGCALTPNGTLLLSFRNDLTSNWREASNDFESGVVQILSASQNAAPASCLPSSGCNGGCDPSVAYVQTPQLNGSITRAERIGGAFGLTETALSDRGSAGEEEQGFLTAQCSNIVQHGSHKGICSCEPNPPPPTPTATATQSRNRDRFVLVDRHSKCYGNPDGDRH